ncbi:DUF6020 family protein [Slackia piriformis]|uniref:DUF6020 family protein n=1 Tax=Slackia piriformis TaxID=626934 RepID=UPI002943A089|nr:DUF6020 family protein [Slackia piriformis]
MQLDVRSRQFLANIQEKAFPTRGSIAIITLLSMSISASYVLVYWSEGQTSAECFWTFVGFSAILFCLFAIVFAWLASHQSPVPLAESTAKRTALDFASTTNKKLWLACFLVLFASYFATLLLSFPGTFSTDSYASISILQGELPWSNAHPVFYTLLIGPFVALGNAVGNMTVGLFAFSLVQLTLMAAVCSYACAWLRKMGMPLLVVFAALAFFAFNPVIARYATTMWKDVPFAMTMLLAILQLFEIALTKGAAIQSPRACIKLALLTLLTCLLRNNGIYAMAASVVVLIAVWRKAWKWFMPMVGAIVLAQLISGPFYTSLGIEPSPFRESVGIPIQQISAVVAEGGKMTEEQLEVFSQLVDPEAVAEVYAPYSSNFVKYHESFSDEWLNAHKKEFLQLYFEVGLKNPAIYTRAWIGATQGYWNMETHSWVVSEAGRNLAYEATGLEILNGDSETNYDELRKSSFLSPLFNMGFAAWVMIALCAFRWIKGDRKLITAYIPLIALWGTMLIAAPFYCEFRYQFPIHLLLPVIFASAFFTTASNTSEEKK